MGSLPAPDRPSPARRRAPAPASLPPGSDAHVTATDLLLHTWAGRLFLLSAGLKLLVAPFRIAGDPPAFVAAVSIAATIGLILAVSYFVWRLVVLMKRRLLWRVRRKLIISYIFIGVIPAALIVGFFLVGASTLAMNISAYMFKDGYDDVVSEIKLYTEAAANEVARAPAAMRDTIERVHRNGARKYPELAIAFVPAPGSRTAPVVAGRWEHLSVPPAAPAWLTAPGFEGTVAIGATAPDEESQLVIRVMYRVANPAGTLGHVVSDLPVDAELLQRLFSETGVLGGSVRVGDAAATGQAVPVVGGLAQGANAADGRLSLFRRSVSFFDAIDWETRQVRRATVALSYRLGELYRRVSRAQSTQVGPMTLPEAILLLLVVVAVLFLIIQLVALIMGLALARSITSSIHELFMGTERVRHGDFAHRIDIPTKDQLGELADSFNQMTGSIEGLLQTAAEKKRLEEELRIARQIQMSLLPRGPLNVPGLGITALCVPAREVGGDYYDFFRLSHERLGVLIADVSGKGTSAALYMAELKGLVLALSQMYASPRALLIEVNRIISEHLDSRSFITMTYAVIDLQRGTMTYCRAGHTPLIFFPALDGATARVLTPSGMVLGLQIEGAAEKFDELLEEEQVDLSDGDVIVLYTDGISEAMNADNDLFGEPRLSRLIEEHGHLESGELRERILRELESFVGGADQHDDMTMILLKVDRVFAARVAV